MESMLVLARALPRLVKPVSVGHTFSRMCTNMLKLALVAKELIPWQGEVRCPSIIYLNLRFLMFEVLTSWPVSFLLGETNLSWSAFTMCPHV